MQCNSVNNYFVWVHVHVLMVLTTIEFLSVMCITLKEQYFLLLHLCTYLLGRRNLQEENMEGIVTKSLKELEGTLLTLCFVGVCRI